MFTGADFLVKEIAIDSKLVTLQIWDTGTLWLWKHEARLMLTSCSLSLSLSQICSQRAKNDSSLWVVGSTVVWMLAF